MSDLNHVELQQGRVLVMHGDGLFPNISPWSPRVGLIAQAVERELATFGPDPTMEERLAAAKRAVLSVVLPKPQAVRSRRGRIAGILRELWPLHRPWMILKTWLDTSHRAVAFAERHRPKAEVLIIGHIHAPTVRRLNRRLIINTGCFLPPLWRYCVDVTGKELSIRRVRRGAGEAFEADEKPLKSVGGA